jgi:hypothetical protein
MRNPAVYFANLGIEKMVLFRKAKPRYLDMVSYFKAACKHHNPFLVV